MKRLNKTISWLVLCATTISALCLFVLCIFPEFNIFCIGNVTIELCLACALTISRLLYYAVFVLLIALAFLGFFAIRKNIRWLSFLFAGIYAIDLFLAVLYATAQNIIAYFSFVADSVILVLFAVHFMQTLKSNKKKTNP